MANMPIILFYFTSYAHMQAWKIMKYENTLMNSSQKESMKSWVCAWAVIRWSCLSHVSAFESLTVWKLHRVTVWETEVTAASWRRWPVRRAQPPRQFISPRRLHHFCFCFLFGPPTAAVVFRRLIYSMQTKADYKSQLTLQAWNQFSELYILHR